MKAYSEYKDSGIDWIGKIPKGWEIKKLSSTTKEIANRINWRGLNTGDYVYEGEGARMLVVGNVQSNSLTLNGSEKYIKWEKYEESPEISVKKGDILLTKSGSIGRCCVVKSDLSPTTINSAIIILRTNDLVNSDYFAYYINSSNCHHQIMLDVNMSAQPNIFRKNIIHYKIIVPSLPEQKVIASFLDNKTSKINDLVKNKQKLIDLLKEQRLAIINHAVTKGLNKDVELVDSGVNWIGKVPKHWTVNKLKYVSELLFSNVDKKTNEGETSVKSCNYVDVYKNEFIDSNISFLDIGATDNEIDKFSIKKGDVLVTKDSETPQDIAVPALVTFESQNILCGYHLAMIREKNDLIGDYVFRIFQSKDFNTHFEISAKGVTRYGLSMEAFKNAFVPIPPISEQKQIVTFLNTETSQIDKSIEKIQKEIELLQEYKEALISEAVTGKIKIEEAS